MTVFNICICVSWNIWDLNSMFHLAVPLGRGSATGPGPLGLWSSDSFPRWNEVKAWGSATPPWERFTLLSGAKESHNTFEPEVRNVFYETSSHKLPCPPLPSLSLSLSPSPCLSLLHSFISLSLSPSSVFLTLYLPHLSLTSLEGPKSESDRNSPEEGRGTYGIWSAPDEPSEDTLLISHTYERFFHSVHQELDEARGLPGTALISHLLQPFVCTIEIPCDMQWHIPL